MSSHSDRKMANGGRKTSTAYKVAFGGMMAVLALVFSYVETIFPAAPGVPGVKLGLANLVVLVVLYRMGVRYAWMVNAVRIILAGLLFSGVFGILYSMAGCIVSFCVMLALKKTNVFSIVGVSMAGGVAHNLGQILVAVVLSGTASIFSYFPVLILSGTAAGIVIGFAAYELLKHIPGIVSAS